MAIHCYALSQYILCTVEAFLPQTMTDHRDESGRVEPSFAVRETSAAEQTHAQRFKKFLAYRSAVIRIGAATDTNSETFGRISHQRSQRLALLRVVQEIRVTVAKVQKLPHWTE